MEGDSSESALNKVLRDSPLLISTHIFAFIATRNANHIQTSWPIVLSSHPD
jgi:hypothetical protein